MQIAPHREQLAGMLCEAAEIEHCLMCCYLYAGFSLKEHADEGLDEVELAAVRRWKREVIRIATDEMLHLALANNLLLSIGASPHYRRFNFPISGGLFPADIGVALTPFDEATLDHFVYVERPRDVAERDGASYSAMKDPSLTRRMLTGRLMLFTEDYDTVGELYQTIAESFRVLHDSLGAQRLFVGPQGAQLGQQDFRLGGLCRIADLKDALAAIELIVRQGEGSASEQGDCHYARFVAIRREWQQLKARRPGFVPYRPAARNPVMRSPVTTDRVQVLAEPASRILDAGNAAYVLMQRLLALMSDEHICTASDRRAVADQTLLLMHVVADVGSLLTTLPARDDLPGVNAGLTFTVSRQSLHYPSRTAAAAVLEEATHALGRRLEEFVPQFPQLRRHAAQLMGWQASWITQEERAAPAVAMPQAAPEAAAPPAASPAAPSSSITTAVGQDLTVHFDTKRCIHARHCVTGEPEVFLANVPGDWIYPDNATPERLAIVAHCCPSGAITYERHDGRPGEAPPKVNLVRVRENGPLAVHAGIALAWPDGRVEPLKRATLCRCGRSSNKPFCDGSHTGSDGAPPFVTSGEIATRPSEPLAVRDGRLDVEPLRNGPLELRGNLEILCGTGRTVDRLQAVRLCRCGRSGDKPFCDGSHAAAGFVADGV
jgi:CDGSH-type Zn-finger protein/uncharacterized Fe-S cluster protein YjdI